MSREFQTLLNCEPSMMEMLMKSYLLLTAKACLATSVVRVCFVTSLLSLLGFVSGAHAQIVLDFSNDSANQRFFNNNSVARAALVAAAEDISAAINFDLTAVEDITNGSAGTTSLDFDFSYNYLNPSTNSQTTIQDTATPANEYRVFVGARPLGAPLGEGGTGGISFAAGGVFGSGSLADAIADAEANDTHRRGGGPLIGSLDAAFDTGESVFFPVGLTVGTLVMNSNVNWHFNHTTPVTAGANDFYSVALHELLHTLGIGASDAWNSQVSGRNWLGSESIAVNGTGVQLVAPDGDHFTDGVMSRRLTDGVFQETVIDPELLVGTRRGLTLLDLAVLRDLGFETNDFDVPTPLVLGDLTSDNLVNFLDISPFISVLSTGGFQSEADINGDGVVNFLDISPFIDLLGS